jgi:hypothetical protein
MKDIEEFLLSLADDDQEFLSTLSFDNWRSFLRTVSQYLTNISRSQVGVSANIIDILDSIGLDYECLQSELARANHLTSSLTRNLAELDRTSTF